MSKRNEKPSVAVGDLETDPFKEGRLEINPFCAGYSDGKITKTWWGPDCAKQFIDFLRKRGKKETVYFHNGGNFDFHFLLEYLPVNDCEFMCMGKRIVKLKTPWGTEFRDSFAIIPKKLAVYGKKEIDYKRFEKEVREKHKTEILEYLRSDLENLLNMVNGYFKRFPEAVTLASSVFKLMKTEYAYDPGRSSEAYDTKFRPFFFGGRVQFWKLGKIPGKYHIVDINSAYPYAMTKQHWFGFKGSAIAQIPKKKMEQSLFVINCWADGCFPERQKHGGVSFPTKKGDFWVTGWELKAAMDLKLCKDVKVRICYVPEEIRDIKRFSETLYGRKLAAKKAGDKEEEFFNKIAVNAGYGKLALNVSRFKEVKVTTIYDKPDRWKDRDEKKKFPEKPDWDNAWDDKDRGLSFWSRSSYKEGIDKFINVATAASITGYVRAMLLRASVISGGSLYCDTDSLILANIKKLSQSEELGAWKLELTIDSTIKKGVRKAVEHDSGIWIAGKKLYAAYGYDPKGEWKWKIASKGVKLTPERIISVALGNKETMTFEAPTFSLFSKPKFVTREINRAKTLSQNGKTEPAPGKSKKRKTKHGS